MEVGVFYLKVYKRPTKENYKQYHKNAYHLLSDIAEFFKVDYSQLTFDMIVEFFEDKFNLLFIYFEPNLMYNWFPKKKQELKFELTTNNLLKLVDYNFCSVCSGMTIPDLTNNRYVIYINQDVVKSRVMFTILHELSHIYYHLNENNYIKVLASKTNSKYSESYPPEILPLEEEANTIASILFLNDHLLLKYIGQGLTFQQIKDISEMSGTALHNRFMNFLMYNFSCTEYYALSIIQSFKKGERWAIITLQGFQRENLNTI